MTETTGKTKKKDAEKKASDKKSEEPVCTTATVAEHSRMDNADEPCDDGRAGK